MARAKGKRNEVAVGAFLFLGLAALAGLILQYANIAQWAEGRYPLTVVFEDGSGLIKGSTVRMRGAKIGEVRETPELTERLEVTVALGIDDQFRIPEGSKFQISSASLLGDKEIIVTPPPGAGKVAIAEGAVVKGGGAYGLERLQGEAEQIVEDVRVLANDTRVALSKADAMMDDVRVLALLLGQTVQTVNEDVLSSRNLENVSDALAGFALVADNAQSLVKRLEPTAVEVERTLDEVRDTAREAQSVLAKAEPGLRKVPGVLAQVEDTAAEFEKTAAAVKKTADQATLLVKKYGEGDGALSTLATDGEVKGDIKSFTKNLRKYGILGYRDAESKEDDPRERFQGRRR